MINYLDLKNCVLFNNLEEISIKSLVKCFNIVKRTFKKNDYIINNGDEITHVLVIKHGSVNIVEDDWWGNRTIISNITDGSCFGLAYAYSYSHIYPVSVVAQTNVTIYYIDVNKIFTPCSKLCCHHDSLIKNSVNVLSVKNIDLVNKITNISKKTTKEKVLSYLSSYSKKVSSNEFTIPFNREELAEYLGVERSALSFVLSNLKKEGLLDYNKSYFKLKFTK